MNRNTIIALIVAAALAAGALVMCSKGPGPASTATPAVPEAPAVIDRTPAAPDMAVGESCSAICPDATKAEIICAEGEKPVCDCAATPRTQCLPPAKP